MKKRSRAFILSEQLMTIMLQASFIIVLCASFYQLISFYTRTQQVLTARNHAERVISFMDEKIRNAGLGLWRCKSPREIKEKLQNISMLGIDGTKQYINRGYKLPLSLKWNKDGMSKNKDDWPLLSSNQNSGDVLTLLYARRDLSSGNNTLILHTAAPSVLARNSSLWESDLKLMDKSSSSLNKFFVLNDLKNIKCYSVMEAWGIPASVAKESSAASYLFRVYGLSSPSSADITIPAASELMGLNCMQMFVHDANDGQGRQFAFRELQDNGTGWDKTYNQEKGILDIYMEVDRGQNIFTLWVLASGGYDASMNNPRPDSWPKEANPQGDVKATDNEQQRENKAKAAWLASDYCHHIVYVSRAQWKLNNIPQGFTWN